ncbi:MAG TPA: 50S ribosomal protein L17 [Patescibacteria group bacterium]|nr:50S ribosomal protein L17 [Patescibacteria group bacterium]
MKKQVFGRQLHRDTNQRKALFKGLVSELVMHERIETTEQKAKAIRAQAEKLVTKAKKNDSAHAKELLQAYLTTEAQDKMISTLAPRFADRPGGYTRILKLGNRFSDDAAMVVMEWVVKSSRTSSQTKKASPSQPQTISKEVLATASVSTPSQKVKKSKIASSRKTSAKRATKKEGDK